MPEGASEIARAEIVEIAEGKPDEELSELCDAIGL